MWDGAESARALVADDLREGRYGDALGRLYAEAEQRPGDRSVDRAIELVRERMAEAVLAKLGNTDAVPRIARETSDEQLDPDEAYLLSRIDEDRSVEELLRSSTLGRHRTARVLAWLVERGLVRLSTGKTSGRGFEAPSAGPIDHVLVADASATQASLVRTMLRVSLGRAVRFTSAASADELLERVAREKPGLVVLDYRLPGRGDGIATLRLMRSTPALAVVPAVLVVQRVELDYVEAHLPPHVAVLVRPIDRESLEGALRRVAPGAISR